MMQRNQRLDSAFAQVKELFPVALECVVVVATRLGFHARPLHADARDLQTKVAHELVVFAPAAPVVGSGVRGSAVLGDPLAPVVGARRSFDLQPGRCGTDADVAEVHVLNLLTLLVFVG